MKYLVVNADDFGMAESINEGIARALNEGIVTSTSILGCGDAFSGAVRIARERGIRDVGAHLALSEVTPIAFPHKLKSHRDLVVGLLSRRITFGEIRAEFKRQLDRIRGEGLEITHLDSHENIHMLPGIMRIFLELAGEYNVPAMRRVRGEMISGAWTPKKAYRVALSGIFEARNGPLFAKSKVLFPDRIAGVLNSGRLTEGGLLEMLDSLQEGVTELIGHPGFISPAVTRRYCWHASCEEELYALTSRRVRRRIDEIGIRLVSYREAIEEGFMRRSHLLP
jgi:predicted glycoside hydrolase/deacetylase ChbG (UPF0249 family)